MVYYPFKSLKRTDEADCDTREWENDFQLTLAVFAPTFFPPFGRFWTGTFFGSQIHIHVNTNMPVRGKDACFYRLFLKDMTKHPFKCIIPLLTKFFSD